LLLLDTAIPARAQEIRAESGITSKFPGSFPGFRAGRLQHPYFRLHTSRRIRFSLWQVWRRWLQARNSGGAPFRQHRPA